MDVNLSDRESILAAPLPSLAQTILRRAANASEHSRRNFVAEAVHTLHRGPQSGLTGTSSAKRDPAVAQALAEGWDYLERHGLVSREPLDERSYFVTRRGRDVLDRALPLPDEPRAGRPLE